MLRLVVDVRPRGVRLRAWLLHGEAAEGTRFAEDHLAESDGRGGFEPAVMIGAPQRRLAVELLEHGQDHPRGVVHRSRIAAAVVGQQQRVFLFRTAEETPENAFHAVVQQPAEAQQHVPRAGGAHPLFHAPQRLAARAERVRLVLLAVGGGAGAVEHAVAGRLHQQDVVVLAQLGKTLDGALLAQQAGFVDRLGLEPVEVVGEVDHRIRAGFVQQQRQAGGVPPLLGRTGRQEADIFLGAETDQRLSKGTTTTQQHQAHSHLRGGTRDSWVRTGQEFLPATLPAFFLRTGIASSLPAGRRIAATGMEPARTVETGAQDGLRRRNSGRGRRGSRGNRWRSESATDQPLPIIIRPRPHRMLL
ncbi:hypothetical protein D9M71_288480 [compost metagenome]